MLDDAGGRFVIGANSGFISVADASLQDFETSTSHTITVQATDAAGATFNKQFTVFLTDSNEFPVSPVIDTNNNFNSVTENAVVGTSAGVTAVAFDADSTNNTVSYTLVDNDGGRFAIDATTGVVTVSGAIDRENDGPVRTITVRATSTDGSYSDQNFSITINDVDEFNVGAVSDVNAASNAVNENAAAGTTVGITATASDADATTSTITYSLSSNDGGRFAIDSTTGVVTVAGAIDRESDGPCVRSRCVPRPQMDLTRNRCFTITINDVDEFDIGPVTDTNAIVNAQNENAAIGMSSA